MLALNRIDDAMHFADAVIEASAAAVLTLAPGALVTALWVGPQVLAVAIRDSAPTYAVAGVAIIAGAALIVALYVSLIGVWRGRRSARMTWR